MWAMPPLFSYTSIQDDDFEEFDFLYPLLTYDRFGNEYRFQIFQVFYFRRRPNPAWKPTSASVYPVPVLLSATLADPRAELHRAASHLRHICKNRLFRDEIHFVTAAALRAAPANATS